jgi:Flp pilus assembly protein TadD/5-hydroxyisourate hydrolase-like protein (transthyretin family)
MRTAGRILCSALIFIWAFQAASLGTAITGAVDGTIKDMATGQPVSGVKITLVSAKTESLTFEMTTDQKGHFYKSGLIPGIYKMTLEKEGYVPQGGSIRVVLDETTRLDLKLEPAKGTEAGSPAMAKTVVAGNALITAGKYDEAIAQLGEAIVQLPLYPIPYFYRGLAYEKSGKSEEALQDFQKAIELKADFILPHLRSGMIWAKKGDFEKAGEFYKKALDSGDQDPTTQYNYGVCLTNLGKSAEARDAFEKLLAKDPEYSDVFYQLAILCLNAGETARAKELLEKFIVKDPENKNAALAKEILKSLNQEPWAAR